MAAILPFGTEFSAPAPDAPSPPPLPVAPNGRRYESALRDGGWAIWSGLILAPLVGVDFLGDGQGGPWGISSLAWEHFVSFIPHHSYAIEPRPGLSVLPSGRKAAGCVVLHDGAYSWYEGGSNHTLVVSREREPPRRPSFFTLQASREAFRLRRASLDRDLRRVPILWGEVLHDEPNIRVKH